MNGVTVAIQRVLDSKGMGKFLLLHLDTSDHRGIETIGRLDWRNVALALQSYIRLILLLLGRRVDIVYLPISQSRVGFLRDSVYLILARLLSRARVVIHLHGGYFGAFYAECGWLFRRWVDLVMRIPRRVVVLAEVFRDIFTRWLPPASIDVVPNGTNLEVPGVEAKIGESGGRETGMETAVGEDGGSEHETFLKPLPAGVEDGPSPAGTAYGPPPAEAAYGLPPAEAACGNVTFMSSLMASKGIIEYVRAARECLAACPGLTFHIAGEWVEEETRVEALALLADVPAERVRVHGVVTGAAKIELLRATDIFVLPTWYPFEGQPTVIIEAMAAGCAVVATRHAAIPELVAEGETGLLVPRRDTPALAAAILALARDPARRQRIGAAAYHRYRAEYTTARSNGLLLESFNKACQS